MNVGATSNNFGGDWTIEKLEILEKYLNAYTTALQSKSFKLIYIDAFAGSGTINLKNDDDARSFYEGSVLKAIKVQNKSFDRLLFIENDLEQCGRLAQLRQKHHDRDIRVEKFDANFFLRDKLKMNWREWRGVLFLDPFATEVEWATIKKIAGFEALDAWILFPISAIARILPVKQPPEGVLANSLNRIFSDGQWQELYSKSPQMALFDEDPHQREQGVNKIINLYKGKLKTLFSDRFMEKTKTFKNSKNSPLFEFIFCAGHPRGAILAKKIAGHILNADH